MATINQLIISTQTSADNFSWTPTAIRTSQLDATNPAYPRIFTLDNQCVKLTRPNAGGAAYTCALSLPNLAAALVAIVPQLTWPPLIGTQPVSLPNQVPASSVVFTVAATAEIAITYQWKYSTDGGVTWSNVGAGTSGGTTDSLTVTGANPPSYVGKQYECVCTNASGSTTTNAVGASSDPQVVTQPVNASCVHSSTSANFSCAGSGLTALSYQWQYSSNSGVSYSNLTNGGIYSNVTTAAMTVTPTATTQNGYYYRCIITDSNGFIYTGPGILTVT